jgi:hypothetical protein
MSDEQIEQKPKKRGRRTWTEEEKQQAREKARARIAKQKAQAAAAPEILEGAAVDTPVTTTDVAPAPLLLDDYERERIEAEARKLVDEELAKHTKKERDKLLKDELDKEVLRQRRLAGLVDHQDDIVEFLINVGPFSSGVTIDGKHYPHGTWVKKTRREYDSIRDIMARSWESEDRAGNPNRRFAQERALAGISDPTLRETRMSDGTFTLGWSHNINVATGAASPAARRALANT